MVLIKNTGEKMKILIAGDFHYTEKQPGSRRDSIGDAFFSKLTQICTLTKELNADILVQPGDFFNSHRANDLTKSKIFRFLRENFPLDEAEILTLYGQHDLRYHRSNTENTPLNVLDSAGFIKILNSKGLQYDDGHDKIDFYGASWFEDIPKPVHNDNFNILVLHKMVVDEKIWEGQEDYVYHNILLKRNTVYNLIISGDNHKTFTAKSGTDRKIRYLVNAGCLLRTRIDQEDHRPCVFIFDTKDRSMEQIFLEVKPFDEVIRIEEAKKEKEESETLKKYAAALKANNQITGINYRKNIQTHIKKNRETITDLMSNFINLVFAQLEEE